jgi:hypothetical protein
MKKVLYLIGSLRNPRIPSLAKRLREENPDVEVFDDWYAAGPEADDYWKSYEQGRGRAYQDALKGYAARHVFDFDKFHLDRATHTLLVLPAGKSGHMECMYAAYGVGSETAILLDAEDVRWDVMYQFIPTILESDDEVSGWLQSPTGRRNEARVADGGRPARLLSECPSRSGPPFQISWRETYSWGASPLETGGINGSSKQDTETLGRLWKEGYGRK